MKSVQLFTAYSLSLAPVFCGHVAHLRRLLLNLLPLLLYLMVKGGEWSLNEAGQMLFVLKIPHGQKVFLQRENTKTGSINSRASESCVFMRAGKTLPIVFVHSNLTACSTRQKWMQLL